MGVRIEHWAEEEKKGKVSDPFSWWVFSWLWETWHSSEGREITVVMICQAQCWCVWLISLHTCTTLCSRCVLTIVSSIYYILKQFLPKKEEHSHCQNLKCNTDLHASPELHCRCNIRWIFYQVAFLHRDTQFLPFIYTTILFQSFKQAYIHARGWYCLTKTVEEKIAPLLPSFLQNPPRIPETCKEEFRFIKKKRRGCRWFWWKELQRESKTPAARGGEARRHRGTDPWECFFS
jgi:hypothetical protein